MQLVEDDAPQAAEQRPRVAVREQQRELLRGRQQDVRRPLDLPGALVRRRIAGAGLDADRAAPISRDRRLEVARDVDRERLQGRDVEGVEPPLALP